MTSCANVIIIDFLVFSIVRILEEINKIMKDRSPLGVTIAMKTVIFMELTKYRHENPDGAQELRTLEIAWKTEVFEGVPRGPTGAIGKFQLSNNWPGPSHHSL